MYVKNLTVEKYFLILLICISLLMRLNISHVYYSVKYLHFCALIVSFNIILLVCLLLICSSLCIKNIVVANIFSSL